MIAVRTNYDCILSINVIALQMAFYGSGNDDEGDFMASA